MAHLALQRRELLAEGGLGDVQDVGRLDDRVSKLKKHFIDIQNDVAQIEISTGKIARRGAQIEAVELSDLPALPAPPQGMPVAPLRAN